MPSSKAIKKYLKVFFGPFWGQGVICIDCLPVCTNRLSARIILFALTACLLACANRLLDRTNHHRLYWCLLSSSSPISIGRKALPLASSERSDLL
jgi:hypothetical protein